MAKRERLGLTAVRTEGAILPASILQRIHREDPGLDGLKPEQYGLAGDRLREAASRAWNALQGPWTNFNAERAKLAPSEAGTSITRNRWLNPILRELHFGPVEPARENLKFEDKEFPVSHLYGHAPLHLIGCNLDLDKRTPGAAGAAKMSPHGLLQSCLNARKENLWGYVSNGLWWRVLRDDNSLSRQSMVEFDLEAIFEGQLYDEFLLFFLVCHRSRLESETPEQCWLERWSQAAGEEGKRALDTLRDGVQKSIETLGQGFLRHPANTTLRERVRSGQLDKQDYYRQLLRMVYRFLFLFVAEDRGLLLDPKGTEAAKALYVDEFSTQRLRVLAERMRGSSRHHDLFSPIKLILAKLGQPEGCPQLALPALGGFLFSEITAPELDASEIANCDLLEAVRSLAVTREGGRQARIDYKNLGTEELGSVYESLLELHPDLASDGTWFELKSASGNERKTSGSYYTPDSLIQCLLDTALDPVVEAALKRAGTDPEARARAILDLRVIDPAVGSGHFLIAAAHRLAKRLAQVRTGEDEPSPDETRHALREVVGRCLFGIDLNPMAAELCKVSLWIEALEPGRPLSFLDHHVVVGNSLFGTTPALVSGGIPDDAYDHVDGDDKAVCAAIKKRNKDEKRVIAGKLTGNLFDPAASGGRELIKAWQELESLPDESLGDVQAKDKAFRDAEASIAMRKLLADAWCAAFVLPKTSPTLGDDSSGLAITTATLRRLANGQDLTLPEVRAVQDATRRFGFLHPHFAFPDAFAKGGFDVVLGNPPWGQIQFEPEEFFASSAPEIAQARNMAARNKLIDKLPSSNPNLFQAYRAEIRHLNGTQVFIHGSARFPFTSFGRLNTASLFTELSRGLLRPGGLCGLIVPTGIATDSFNQFFFGDIVQKKSLVSLLSFENEEFIFPAIHHATKFCLLTCGSSVVPSADRARFVFSARSVQQALDPERQFTLDAEEISLLNPNTGTCPIFRSGRDAAITAGVYRNVPVLMREQVPDGNPWAASFQLMFMMNTDSHRFLSSDALLNAGCTLRGNEFVCGDKRFAPLYEGKMIHHYDHRWGTYKDATPQQLSVGTLPSLPLDQKMDPCCVVQPQYWVPNEDVAKRLEGDGGAGDVRWNRNWFLGWRDITSSVVLRTVIATIFPRSAVGNKIPLIFALSGNPPAAACLVANLSAFVLDYIARQKLGGTNLNFYILKQLAIHSPTTFFAPDRCPLVSAETWSEWILPRVLELTYTAHDLAPFACDLGYDGPPFIWDEERRFWLRTELDAAFFHLYGIARDDVDYILETFPIVKRKDITSYGSYRTKEAILSVYDELAEAIRMSVSYSSRLDPPPASGWTPPPLHQINYLGEVSLPKKAELPDDRGDGLAGLFALDQD